MRITSNASLITMVGPWIALTPARVNKKQTLILLDRWKLGYNAQLIHILRRERGLARFKYPLVVYQPTAAWTASSLAEVRETDVDHVKVFLSIFRERLIERLEDFLKCVTYFFRSMFCSFFPNVPLRIGGTPKRIRSM